MLFTVLPIGHVTSKVNVHKHTWNYNLPTNVCFKRLI